MPFKLSLVSDVRSWLKGTADVEQSLEQLADSLDTLARDTKTNADQAGDALSREFSTAFDKVKTEARTAGRKVGDEMETGTRRATDGVRDFRGEADQSAREAAASFDGSAESIGDMFQEVAANAFAGFGPAGAIAGLAAAAGLGVILTKLEEAEQQTEDYRASVADLAGELLDVGGNLDSADLQDYVQKLFLEGLDQGTTRLKKWTAAGIDATLAAKALTGDTTAQQQVLDGLNTTYQDLGRAYQSGDTNATKLMGTNREITDDFILQTGALGEAATAAQAVADATDELTGAQKDAKQASEDFSQTLTDNLSVADDGLDEFVHKGKLSLDEWTSELKRRTAENKTVQDFTVNIAPKLSDDALNNFAKLPIETQSQIAKAFNEGSKTDKKQIVQNLEAEAKVSKVTIDTTGAQAQAAKTPLEIPTTVATAGAIKGAQQAADDAQSVASRSGNEIEFKTKLNTSGLQGAVNRAAAGINPPTIWVTVKAKKEVP